MLRFLTALVVVCSLVVGLPVAADMSLTGPVSADTTPEQPRIVDIYPNPPADGDAGEFVTVAFPAGANVSAYTLADEQTEVSLSLQPDSATLDDRRQITFSTAANQTNRLTDRTVRPLSDTLRLANGGDRVRLLRGDTVVDAVRYDQASEAEVYNATRAEWYPLRATQRSIVAAGRGEVEAFVLPDSPDRARELLDTAQKRVYLAGYTLSSQPIVEALVDAHERGVTVEVLVDGSPVGGMSAHAGAALDELQRAGIDVRVNGGEYARYRFHHAKYAVVDGQALVTTENWKPSGTGGQSSRGWGVITDQTQIVAALTETFHADSGWVDAIPWAEYEDASVVSQEKTTGSYPKAFEAERFAVERTELLLAPDNAEARIRELIRNAEHSLDIKQVRIGDEQFPFLQDVIGVAERGVEVRILLAGEWYVREENEQLQAWLEDQAEAASLPLSVRIASPGNSFEKIHAKGLVVDGRQTVIGSLNWNNNSLRENREVALLVESSGVGEYFGQVFEADWNGGSKNRDLPLGLALAALFVAALAVLAATSVEFEQ